MLANKSLTEIRGIAQSLSIADVFQKDKTQLLQAIELKQQAAIPAPPAPMPKPQYDARLMTKQPSRRSNQADIELLLAEHVKRGLRLTFDEERWYMSYGKKTDEGTLRMPLRVVRMCADKIIA